MRKFGLIGYPLAHSFSQGFFTEKFLRENIGDAVYNNYPIEHIELFKSLWDQNPELEGLNVTIPHKKAVIPYLDKPSSVVKSILACNCIRKFQGEFYGYNTDVIGFEKSLLPFLKPHHTSALLLGTGGASAAVEWVLKKLHIQYQIVSRTQGEGVMPYSSVTAAVIGNHTLVINTTPVGTFPKVDAAPTIPYHALTAQHHLYDLVYNPAETLFMSKGASQGATTQNGLAMLHIQAQESWNIWNASTPVIQ